MGNEKTPHRDRVRTIPTEERSFHTQGNLRDPLQQASVKLSHQLSDNFAQHSLFLFIVSWANLTYQTKSVSSTNKFIDLK